MMNPEHRTTLNISFSHAGWVFWNQQSQGGKALQLEHFLLVRPYSWDSFQNFSKDILLATQSYRVARSKFYK